MKKIVGLLLCGGFLLNSFVTDAQSYADQALLFSRTTPGGSARIQAMGGAQVSLGGDYSSGFSNPAGLGMYNHSEFTFTPGFTSTNTSSDYLGTTTPASQSKLIIPGLSLVFHKNKDNGKLLGGTFGLTYNRTNDFNSTFSYGGVNSNNSIIDYFVADANSNSNYYNAQAQNTVGPGQLFYNPGYLYESPTRLAYDQFLINENSIHPGNTDSTHYGTDVTGIPTQHETVQTSGGQSQLNVSYGVNLSDKVFLGGGIGLAFLNYKRLSIYTESFPSAPLSSLALIESLSTKGTGINATIGTIIRPLDFLQVGVSIATPTYYFSVQDSYSASMSSVWSSFPYTAYPVPTPSSTDQVLTNYNLQTPWRLNAGLTYFIQKHGLVSADIEYLNYASNHYTSSNGDDFSADNADIKSLYRSVVNFRLGAEYRLNKFRVRAGFNVRPDPYKITNNVDAKIQSYSAGGGYRAAKFSVDVAAIYAQGSNAYYPYIGGVSSPQVTTKNTNTTVMVTVGIPLRR
jgi:hypothetical protein